MSRLRHLAVLLLGMAVPACAQSIFNCGSFATTGACSVSSTAGTTAFGVFHGGSLSGSVINFVPTGSTHNGYGLQYQTAVADTAFTAAFTFIPNGQNFAFTFNNQTTNPGYNGPQFSSGAGCEGGFYQAYGIAANNIFALMFDSYSPLTNGGSYTYSSVQLYQQNQSPCNPNDGGSGYWFTQKFSTAPVPLNSPVTTQNTTTGDVYSATVTYDGSTVTLNMYDVTASGSCPGSSCFTQSWSNVSIPSLVDGATAYVGFVAGIGLTSSYPQYIDSFSYTVNTPTAHPGSTATSQGGSPAGNPTYSPAAGAYSGTQSVTLTTPTSGGYICYALAASGLVITPLTDNVGGCAVGTLYSSPVAVASSQTLYAIAGTNAVGLPSGVAQAAYIIGTGPTLSSGFNGKLVGNYR